ALGGGGLLDLVEQPPLAVSRAVVLVDDDAAGGDAAGPRRLLALAGLLSFGAGAVAFLAAGQLAGPAPLGVLGLVGVLCGLFDDRGGGGLAAGLRLLAADALLDVLDTNGPPGVDQLLRDVRELFRPGGGRRFARLSGPGDLRRGRGRQPDATAGQGARPA